MPSAWLFDKLINNKNRLSSIKNLISFPPVHRQLGANKTGFNIFIFNFITWGKLQYISIVDPYIYLSVFVLNYFTIRFSILYFTFIYNSTQFYSIIFHCVMIKFILSYYRQLSAYIKMKNYTVNTRAFLNDTFILFIWFLK